MYKVFFGILKFLLDMVDNNDILAHNFETRIERFAMTELKSIITAKGLKQCHIARVAGMSDVRLSAIAKGHSEPRVSEALRIAAVLGVTVEQAFSDVMSGSGDGAKLAS